MRFREQTQVWPSTLNVPACTREYEHMIASNWHAHCWYFATFLVLRLNLRLGKTFDDVGMKDFMRDSQTSMRNDVLGNDSENIGFELEVCA